MEVFTVSETASAESASEGHQEGAGASDTGSTAEGSGTGTQSADTFAAEREQFQSRVRAEQSRADKAEALARELEAKLNAGTQSGGEGKTEASVDPNVEKLMGQVAGLEQLLRLNTLKPIATTLQGEFALADESLFADENLAKFESPEAFRAAVEASHKSVEARVTPEVDRRVEAFKQEFAAKYGVRLDPPREGQEPVKGEVDIASAGVSDLLGMDDEAFERALRSVN